MYLSYICNALEQPTHIYEPVDFHLLLLHRMFFLFIYLFIKALQHKCWRPVGHQVLQPAKDVKFRTVCLKSCRQEKKSISMMHQDSLEPAAIRFTLECLQESARWSGYFLPAFFMHLYPQEPKTLTRPNPWHDHI